MEATAFLSHLQEAERAERARQWMYIRQVQRSLDDAKPRFLRVLNLDPETPASAFTELAWSAASAGYYFTFTFADQWFLYAAHGQKFYVQRRGTWHWFATAEQLAKILRK